MKSSPRANLARIDTILTTDDTQEMWNSSLSNGPATGNYCIGSEFIGAKEEMKSKNEEATRQLGGLFFKGE
jgi:hypothetical protein